MFARGKKRKLNHTSPMATTLIALAVLSADACTGCEDLNEPAKGIPRTSGLAHDRPAARAADERARERDEMVTTQIEKPGGLRTPVQDPATLAAMRAVPRHAFAPRNVRRRVYGDWPLPIGHGQTISQPYIVALMTELLELTRRGGPAEREGLGPSAPKVLEIGTGSGYQAAVLAHLTPHVYTIEIIEPLFDRAKKVLAEQGYSEVHCRRGDGYFGWKEEAPFDAIIVTCAAGHLPPPLWEQLKPDGRIVTPIGGPYEVQRLVVMTKMPDGTRTSKTVLSVRFVPMTRDKHLTPGQRPGAKP